MNRGYPPKNTIFLPIKNPERGSVIIHGRDAFNEEVYFKWTLSGAWDIRSVHSFWNDFEQVRGG